MAALDQVYNGCYGVNQTYCFTTPGLRSGDGNGNEFLASYSDANAWCRQRGLNLLRIENEAKHVAVREFMLDHEYNSDAMWIGGGLQKGNQQSWVWVDGNLYNGKRLCMVFFW